MSASGLIQKCSLRNGGTIIESLSPKAMGRLLFRAHREKVAAAFLLAMAVTHVVMVINVSHLLRNGYQDFTIFYTAGKMVRSGQASRMYDPEAQYRIEK